MKIKSLIQFAQLTDGNRRSRLRMLGEEEYDNMMRVLWSMPHIDMEVKSEVLDDENTMTISAGSIVTVTCFLDRKSLRDVVDVLEVDEPIPAIKEEEDKEAKKKSWQKQPKKQKTVQKKKKVVQKKKTKSEENKENENADEENKQLVKQGEEEADDENEEESEDER